MKINLRGTPVASSRFATVRSLAVALFASRDTRAIPVSGRVGTVRAINNDTKNNKERLLPMYCCQSRLIVCFTVLLTSAWASLFADPASSYGAACNVGCGTLYVMGINRLYRVDPVSESSATTPPRALTSANIFATPSAPSVSPDGTQAIFTQGNTLQILSVGSGAVHTFLPAVSSTQVGLASWSPDGHEIAYALDDFRTVISAPYGIVIADATTGAVRATWTLAGHDRTDPAWTPDGRHVVVSEQESDAQGHYQALVSIDVTTGASAPITQDSAHNYTKPVVSPDGRLIAAIRSDRGAGLNGTLVVMAADGSGVRVVQSASNARPAWSPDGTYLAYGLHDETYLVPVTGGSPLFVTAIAGSDMAWSNAGSSSARAFTHVFGPGLGVSNGCSLGCGTLVFNGGNLLFRAPIAGGRGQALTTTGTSKSPDSTPAVSPDGRTVAYVAGSLLEVVPLAGGPARRLGPLPFNSNPAWSPNGTAVAVGYTSFSGIDGNATSGAYYTGLAVLDASSGNQLFTYAFLNKATIQPSWTPAGDALVASQSTQGLPFALVHIDLATKSAVLLTHDTAHSYYHAAVSPDARLIAAVRMTPNTKTGDLWVMSVDGQGGHVLASGIADDQIAWSPDGRYIAAGRSGSIVAFDFAGKATVLVTNASQVAWARSTGNLTTASGGASAPVATQTPPSTPMPAQTATTGYGTIKSAGSVMDLNSFVSFSGRVRVGAVYKGTTVIYPGESVRFLVLWLGHKPNVAPSIHIRVTLPDGKSVTLTPQPLMSKGTWWYSRVDYAFPTTVPLGTVTEQMTFHSGATRVNLTFHSTLARPGTARTLH